MDRKIDRDRRLADYIYEDMRPDEVVAMEAEISNDPQMSESYQLNMQVKDYLQAKIQLEEMRSDPQLEDAERLADMAFEVDPPKEAEHELLPQAPKRSRVRKMTYALAVAASVAILLAVGILPAKVDGEGMFDRYYAPFEATDYMQRGADNEMYRNLALGINHYLEGNYRQCIEQFSSISSIPALQPEVHLYSALSYMGLGEYRTGQNILQSSLDETSRYQAETLWYLSLCYVKSGEFDQAREALSQLEMYDGLYKKDAQTLLKKLRRFTP